MTAGIAVIAAVLGVAACSSRAPGTGANPPSSAAAAASAKPSVTTGTALTGGQLQTALAPASAFPGFTENATYSFVDGTGSAALPSQYNLATAPCPTFSAQMIYATWFGQTGIAWAHFDHPTGGHSAQTYDEFIYQFADDGTASSFMHGLRSAYTRCQSYTNVETGESVRVTWVAANLAPVDGGHAMQATGTEVLSLGTVRADLLYVLRANDVYGVVRGGALTAVPGRPAATAVIGGMIRQVQLLSALGGRP